MNASPSPFMFVPSGLRLSIIGATASEIRLIVGANNLLILSPVFCNDVLKLSQLSDNRDRRTANSPSSSTLMRPLMIRFTKSPPRSPSSLNPSQKRFHCSSMVDSARANSESSQTLIKPLMAAVIIPSPRARPSSNPSQKRFQSNRT